MSGVQASQLAAAYFHASALRSAADVPLSVNAQPRIR